mmetsp:Transcript_31244/g.81054  ORF Transcript_31244/g.81054 Transcript_31244/m.81054 type:complete len:223 (-) Transcript_31244:1669-2337(-)
MASRIRCMSETGKRGETRKGRGGTAKARVGGLATQTGRGDKWQRQLVEEEWDKTNRGNRRTAAYLVFHRGRPDNSPNADGTLAPVRAPDPGLRGTSRHPVTLQFKEPAQANPLASQGGAQGVDPGLPQPGLARGVRCGPGAGAGGLAGGALRCRQAVAQRLRGSGDGSAGLILGLQPSPLREAPMDSPGIQPQHHIPSQQALAAEAAVPQGELRHCTEALRG